MGDLKGVEITIEIILPISPPSGDLGGKPEKVNENRFVSDPL
jgi:hypothetical protein